MLYFMSIVCYSIVSSLNTICIIAQHGCWPLLYLFFLASLIEAELFSNLHFSPTYGRFTEEEYDFQIQHKILHLYGGHKTISFFWPFLPRERAASTMGSSY